MLHKVNFSSGVKLFLNLKFSTFQTDCLTTAKELYLSNNLPIVAGRADGYTTWALEHNEKETASSANSIYYGGNFYA